MARNNAWANHRLHTACARLSAAELRAVRTSVFPTIYRTLSHILVVDWYYLDALEARLGSHPFSYELEPFARIADLTGAQREADRRLVGYCERLTDPEAASLELESRDGGTVRERVSDVLGHLFQHQIHHRGQVHAMLSGTSVPPPQLDEFFLRQDVALRARDLEALGLPEG
jgi:uncharacterized damage-inducible protein DinB